MDKDFSRVGRDFSIYWLRISLCIAYGFRTSFQCLRLIATDFLYADTYFLMRAGISPYTGQGFHRVVDKDL